VQTRFWYNSSARKAWRGDQFADGDEGGVEGGIGGLFVGIRFRLPEAAAGAAQKPGGEDLNKTFSTGRVAAVGS